MLSTFHDAHMVEKTRRSKAVQGGVEEVQKPAVVEDYNQHMGGWTKVRIIIIQMVLYNAYLHPKIVHSFQFQVISWSSIMGLRTVQSSGGSGCFFTCWTWQWSTATSSSGL